MDNHMPDRVAHFINNQWVLGDVISNSFFSNFSWQHGLLYLVMGIIILFLIVFILIKLVVVEGQEAIVVERFGKPLPYPLRQGLHFIGPFRRIRERIDLRQFQVEKNSDVKTSDGAFLSISWVLRYSVKNLDECIMNYVYQVERPIEQLTWRVENELRTLISSITFDDLYTNKEGVTAKIVIDQLDTAMQTGLQLDGVTIVEISPPLDIRNAMNAQIAALSKQKAASAEAEVERLHRVGIATAESQSKKLQGEGIAAQRVAIAQGFRQAAELMKEGMPGADSDMLLTVLMQANQNDMVTTAAASGKATVIFVPMNMAGSMVQQVVSRPLSDIFQE